MKDNKRRNLLHVLLALLMIICNLLKGWDGFCLGLLVKWYGQLAIRSFIRFNIYFIFIKPCLNNLLALVLNYEINY